MLRWLHKKPDRRKHMDHLALRHMARQSDFLFRKMAGREPSHSFDISDVDKDGRGQQEYDRDYDIEIKDAEVMRRV